MASTKQFKVRKQKSLFSGGGVKVIVDEQGLREFLQANKDVRDLLVSVGQDVAGEAQATASEAEKGAGGRVTDYASSGFNVRWDNRSKRPQVIVESNADVDTFNAVYFYTQKLWGVTHLRRALYKFTTRGK